MQYTQYNQTELKVRSWIQSFNLGYLYPPPPYFFIFTMQIINKVDDYRRENVYFLPMSNWSLMKKSENHMQKSL